MITRFVELFVMATAGLTDGQYYGLIILLSLLPGCLGVILFERLQVWWARSYLDRVILKKRFLRYIRNDRA